MKRLNLFYISTVLLGVLLFYLFQPLKKEDLSFYGFAENRETEINYNYPVVVEKILIEPGQEVTKGDTLIRLFRQSKKESLQDQEYKIAILKAEGALWKEKKLNQMEVLEFERDEKLEEIDIKIDELKKEIAYKNSLVKKLESISIDSSSYKPLEDEIENLSFQKESISNSYAQRLSGIQKEIEKGFHPYESEISLLQAEKEFEEAHIIQQITVLAPHDGLIGTISCREGEHIPSFKTLLTFYEPHSGIVHGFVHEDLFLKVHIDDRFEVYSLKDETVSYDGKVVGLGSRIVEIPSRLRKVPDHKTYGREVLVEITMDNMFLQKEKVGLRFVGSGE